MKGNIRAFYVVIKSKTKTTRLYKTYRNFDIFTQVVYEIKKNTVDFAVTMSMVNVTIIFVWGSTYWVDNKLHFLIARRPNLLAICV